MRSTSVQKPKQDNLMATTDKPLATPGASANDLLSTNKPPAGDPASKYGIAQKQETPETKNWIEVRYEGKPPERRAHHASFLHNNTLYIHGGEDLHDGILSNMWSLSLEFLQNSQKTPTWIPMIC